MRPHMRRQWLEAIQFGHQDEVGAVAWGETVAGEKAEASACVAREPRKVASESVSIAAEVMVARAAATAWGAVA